MHQRMALTVGFPEFHQMVFQTFPHFFAALPALQTALNNFINEGHDAIAAHEHLILNLGILAGTTLMEVVLLGTNGFGPGSIKAARSLLEAAITAEYLRLHPEAYEDFWNYVHIEKYKDGEFLREYLPESYARLDPELRQSLITNRERVAPRFEKWRSWCKHDLAERARQTGYLESYRTLHALASSFIHVTNYGLQRRFEGDDVHRIAGPPSLQWVAQAFVSSHVLTIGMVHTLIHTFHPEHEEVVASLERDCREAWPAPQ
jgi:hypothetical protein